MRYSRDSYYRFKKLYEQGGETALQEISRAKPIEKNRVESHVEQAVVNMAYEYPAYGQHRAANELKKQGVLVSGSGVRSIWLRHDLENFKRSRWLQEGVILTESQLQALEDAKTTREAHGEIETLHPGYFGAQDTYYVSHIKGIGKIYQQTFIDTYTRLVTVNLYTEKNALVAADVLNDRVLPFYERNKALSYSPKDARKAVLPFYEQQQVPLLRVLTDRGFESCGKKETHSYQLYLTLEDIDYTKTKAYKPQTNGICERFHKTMKNECYDVMFRRKLYDTLEAIQTDVDQWLKFYNYERPKQRNS